MTVVDADFAVVIKVDVWRDEIKVGREALPDVEHVARRAARGYSPGAPLPPAIAGAVALV